MKRSIFFLVAILVSTLVACSQEPKVVAAAQPTCRRIDAQNSSNFKAGALSAIASDCGKGQNYDGKYIYKLYNGQKEVGTATVTYRNRSISHVDGTTIEYNFSTPIKITLGSETFVRNGEGSIGNEGKAKFDFFLPEEKKTTLPPRKY